MPFATVNKVRLHYLDEGAGEPLVILHGLGSSSEDWREPCARFTGRYRVVVPDLRGFGLSDRPPGPYSVAQFAGDVRALLAQLGIDRCHLLGFSMGGAVAFQLALDDPSTVRSLLIVNSLPSFEADTWRKRFMVASRVAMARLVSMERLVRILATRMLPEPHQAELREVLIARHRSNDKASYLAAIRALVGWTVRPRLGELTLPALIVASDDDYTDVEEKRAAAAAMPNARLAVIANSRHVPYADQPEAFSRVVLDFLAER
ncbi:MAG: alpha/beta hydrolase [Pseudomonadota bacterium]